VFLVVTIVRDRVVQDVALFEHLRVRCLLINRMRCQLILVRLLPGGERKIAWCSWVHAISLVLPSRLLLNSVELVRVVGLAETISVRVLGKGGGWLDIRDAAVFSIKEALKLRKHSLIQIIRSFI